MDWDETIRYSRERDYYENTSARDVGATFTVALGGHKTRPYGNYFHARWRHDISEHGQLLRKWIDVIL